MINLTVAANLNIKISSDGGFFFSPILLRLKQTTVNKKLPRGQLWGGKGRAADAKKRPSNVLIGVWSWSKWEMFASSVFTTIMHSAYLAAFSLMDALVVCI